MIRHRLILSLAMAFMAGWGMQAQTLPEYMDAPGGSVVSAGADYVGGNLHKAQEAEDALGLYMRAVGDRQVGRFRLKGNFLFREAYENGVRFASTFHPERPMPYIIADSTGGNWKKQDYLMGTEISLPVVKGRLDAGVRLDLEVGRGAKKIDPRPQAGLCDIEVMPMLAYHIADGATLSAGFIYGTFRETSNHILYDSSHPQKLYLMKGLGQYTYEVFSKTERERKFEGERVGLSLGLDGAAGLWHYGASFKYRNGMENVFDIDYSKPHDRGRYINHDFNSLVTVGCSAPRWGLDIRLAADLAAGSGREIVQHFEASSDVNAWVTDSENPGRYVRRDNVLEAGLQAYIKDETGWETWRFAAEVQHVSLAEEYKVTSSLLQQDVIAVRPGVRRLVHLASGVLALNLGGEYSCRPVNVLEYSQREVDDPTIAEWIYGDFNLPLERCGFSLGAGYSWLLKGGRSIGLDGCGALMMAVEDASCRRVSCGINLSYRF